MRIILLINLVLLTGCASSSQPKQLATVPATSQYAALVDLVASTQIIRSLITNNQLDTILDAHDPAQLALLLNNFSPAQMAFETEIKSTTYPLVVIYYYQADNQSQVAYLQLLNQLAQKYQAQIKFVIIDSLQLFSLAQDADITNFPTIIFSKNGAVIKQLSGVETIEILEKSIQQL